MLAPATQRRNRGFNCGKPGIDRCGPAIAYILLSVGSSVTRSVLFPDVPTVAEKPM
jgi:hypothetical protein